MKFEFDIDLEKLADLVAARIQGPAPDKAPVVPKQADAPKTAAKPAGKAKPASKPGPSAEKDTIHGALREYAGPADASDYKTKRDAALAILHEFAPTLLELKEDDYPKVLAKLRGEPAPDAAPAADEDDPFA